MNYQFYFIDWKHFEVAMWFAYKNSWTMEILFHWLLNSFAIDCQSQINYSSFFHFGFTFHLFAIGYYFRIVLLFHFFIVYSANFEIYVALYFHSTLITVWTFFYFHCAKYPNCNSFYFQTLFFITFTLFMEIIYLKFYYIFCFCFALHRSGF